MRRVTCVWLIAIGLNATALAKPAIGRATSSLPLPRTHVFTSGTDGYHTYRIPAIDCGPDGTLVAFAEGRKFNARDPGSNAQEIDLVYKRSVDEGRTWSPMRVLEHAGPYWSAANPATVVDNSNGRMWVFYIRCKPNRGSETSRPGTDDLQDLARWSDDDGRTWSEPLDLTPVARDMKDKAWRASVPGPGGAIQNRSGRLIVPMWKTPFATFVIYSDDHGRNWRRGECVPGNQGGDECQVVELANGHILMDIRQEQGPHRWLAESADSGETWGKPRPGQEETPVECALERFSLGADGAARNCIVWTGPKGPGRRRLVVRISYDQGKTFNRERVLSDSYAAYSDLTVLRDQTLGILWESGVASGYQFIDFSRLDKDWLEPGPISRAGPGQ